MFTREIIKKNPTLIDTLISRFQNDELYLKMLESDAYYDMKNTQIMERRNVMAMAKQGTSTSEDGEVHVFTYTQIQEDKSKANNKIPHGFHYELVNQCKNFLAGNPVRVTWKHMEDFDESEIEDLKLEVDYVLNDINDWGTFVQIMIKNAQKHSRSYARVNVDSKGNFRFTPVTAKEVIPFYDDYGDIYLAIRTFSREEIDDNAQIITVNYVEIMDDQYKDTYKQVSGEWLEFEMATPLLESSIMVGDIVTSEEHLSWGKVPLIEWKFTDDGINSLEPIKPFIDLADANISDFANDLEDINELVWILKNYDGQNLSDFMRDAKELKAISVGEGGDVRTERNELPHEARVKLYDQVIRNIYRFGRGIDFTDRSNLGNITGTGLKWSYELLEEKANELEQFGQKALDELFYFLFIFMGEKGVINKDLNATNVEFLFDRSLMIDESEVIVNGLKFATFGSLETALEHQPWVDDVDEELRRIRANEDVGFEMEEQYGRTEHSDFEEDDEESENSEEKDNENSRQALQESN